MKLKIGNVTLENNLILAPMAGVTDLPFRLLCKEQGAGLICTEMVSAKAIHFKNKNTESLMEIDERERPVSLQLFGSEPDLMADIAKQIEYRNFDILDINNLFLCHFHDLLSFRKCCSERLLGIDMLSGAQSGNIVGIMGCRSREIQDKIHLGILQQLLAGRISFSESVLLLFGLRLGRRAAGTGIQLHDIRILLQI